MSVKPPKQIDSCITLTRERARHPADGVPEIPYGNANAIVNINASLDAVGVDFGLGSCLFGGVREG
jgi:hypothetical protein